MDLSPAANVETYTFVLYNKDNAHMVVGIKADGNVVYGDEYTPDQAARLFWKIVGESYPFVFCAKQK